MCAHVCTLVLFLKMKQPQGHWLPIVIGFLSFEDQKNKSKLSLLYSHPSHAEWPHTSTYSLWLSILPAWCRFPTLVIGRMMRMRGWGERGTAPKGGKKPLASLSKIPESEGDQGLHVPLLLVSSAHYSPQSQVLRRGRAGELPLLSLVLSLKTHVDTKTWRWMSIAALFFFFNQSLETAILSLRSWMGNKPW